MKTGVSAPSGTRRKVRRCIPVALSRKTSDMCEVSRGFATSQSIWSDLTNARLAGGGRQQRHDLGVRAQAQHGHGVRARQRQRQQRNQLLLRALPVRRAAAPVQRLRAYQGSGIRLGLDIMPRG